MKQKTSAIAALALALLGIGLAPAAQADPYHHGGYRGGHWATGYHFRYWHYDPVGWRGGRWMQTWHGGRYGWWWSVGGVWMLYSAPVYPYPDPGYAPTYVIEDDPGTMVAPAPASQPAPPPPAPQAPAQAQQMPAPQPQVWYYCNSPQGYYPYVQACPTGWQTVPATPPQH